MAHWLAFHMRVDLCCTLFCPIRSETKVPRASCQELFYDWESLVKHLYDCHPGNFRDVLYQAYKIKPGKKGRKAGPRESNESNLKHFIRLELFGSPKYCRERKCCLQFSGLMYRYATLLKFGVKDSSRCFLGQIVWQKLFRDTGSRPGIRVSQSERTVRLHSR